MIVGSIVLVLVATGLLVAGLALSSYIFYYTSIVASVLAGMTLLVGVRQAPAARALDGDFDVRPGLPDLAEDAVDAASTARPIGRAEVPTRRRIEDDLDPDSDESVPPDEPPEQQVTKANAARVAKLGVDVLVIDGRPRYHVPECLHLLGRDYERLPVSEAVELGFTPCAQCEADRVLLAGTPGV